MGRFSQDTAWQGVTKQASSQSVLESRAIEGDSPVGERCLPPESFPSSAGHGKPGVNQGGPPPKAKYKPMTDSVPVA